MPKLSAGKIKGSTVFHHWLDIDFLYYLSSEYPLVCPVWAPGLYE